MISYNKYKDKYMDLSYMKIDNKLKMKKIIEILTFNSKIYKYLNFTFIYI